MRKVEKNLASQILALSLFVVAGACKSRTHNEKGDVKFFGIGEDDKIVTAVQEHNSVRAYVGEWYGYENGKDSGSKKGSCHIIGDILNQAKSDNKKLEAIKSESVDSEEKRSNGLRFWTGFVESAGEKVVGGTYLWFRGKMKVEGFFAKAPTNVSALSKKESALVEADDKIDLRHRIVFGKDSAVLMRFQVVDFGTRSVVKECRDLREVTRDSADGERIPKYPLESSSAAD